MNGNSGAVSVLVEGFLRVHPEQLAAEVESCETPEIVDMFAAMPADLAARLLERLRPDLVADVVDRLDVEHRCRMLEAADPVLLAASLARLDSERLNEILDETTPSISRRLRELISYPPDTAGSIMDPRVPMLRGDSTAEEALELLRRRTGQRVHNVYVVDGAGVYLGRVLIQDIAIADPASRLHGLITAPAVSIQATASQAEVVSMLEEHRILALPVVDFEGRLLGFIRNRSLLEAVEQEATADIQSMVGASREERALSPVTFAVRKRLPWLQINLLTAFLAAAVVGLFEGTIARFTALAVLLPVVAGQSGNTGAQALAVTMRGLALREVGIGHWFRVMTKEVRVAFFNGLAVALTTSLAVYVWSRSSALALVIAFSMVLSMVAAGLAGAAIPMILTAIRQDPAQSSSIILTTVTDVVGFFSFLGIATLMAGFL
jgi:magnesium transporter